jgi:hypothetical protein
VADEILVLQWRSYQSPFRRASAAHNLQKIPEFLQVSAAGFARRRFIVRIRETTGRLRMPVLRDWQTMDGGCAKARRSCLRRRRSIAIAEVKSE